MGHRDIAALEASIAHLGNEGSYSLGMNVDALIGSGNPVFPQPVSVDERRAGMSDRVADDERFLHDLLGSSGGTGITEPGRVARFIASPLKVNSRSAP